MGRIVVSENVSVDGIMQDPTGEEGFKFGGWFNQMPDDVRAEWGKVEYQEALDTAAWLIGRRTYTWFAERWADRPGEWADRLRSIPKYVVSSTLDDPAWNNSRIVNGDVVDEVSKLKQMLDGDIVVLASFQIVRTLLEHDLVDELRLKILPVVLGAGERLFGETSGSRPVRLVDRQTLDDDVAYLTYERSRGS